VEAFRDIGDDQKTVPAFVKFDIVLGVMYSVAAVIEAYGVFAAITNKIPLVRIYAMLSFFVVALVTAIEVMRLVLHFTFKKTLIDNCVNDIRGLTVTQSDGGFFNPHTTTNTISDSEATNDCNHAWSNGIFQDVAWLLVAAIAGFVFATVNYAYYRQLIDPSLLRTQAPSVAYQMNATRNAYGYRNNANNIPGYNPYQTQTYGDYVPPYDANKPPGYTSGGFEHFPDDEKAGYSGGGGVNPFTDNAVVPPHAPPGIEPLNHDRNVGNNNNSGKDEGFDPAALEAAMRVSAVETKGAGKDDSGAGPSSSAR